MLAIIVGIMLVTFVVVVFKSVKCEIPNDICLPFTDPVDSSWMANLITALALFFQIAAVETKTIIDSSQNTQEHGET